MLYPAFLSMSNCIPSFPLPSRYPCDRIGAEGGEINE
nr:MAG TPA: hypothetical protein [Caudoviricetes sp.]